MSYEPIKLIHGKRPFEDENREELFRNCPAMAFYLKPVMSALFASSQAHMDSILAAWESSAPRPVQRMRALDDGGDDWEHDNLILFGKKSGTGKTTVAFEKILRRQLDEEGFFHDFQIRSSISMAGHEFARLVAANVQDLDAWMNPLLEADFLLLDDLDKRGDKDGMFSKIVQQTLFDLIEARTTRGNDTILTMNASGAEFASKFDPAIGPYLLRRLRERFKAIHFDPTLQTQNLVQITATADAL